MVDRGQGPAGERDDVLATRRPTTRRLHHRIVIAAERMRREADRRCREIAGVSAAQAGAMFVVQAEPGCTQRHVAAQLGLAESAVNAMVAKLTDVGLVRREPSGVDGRAMALSLTTDGTAAAARLSVALEEYNATLESDLTATQLDSACEVLDSISRRLSL